MFQATGPASPPPTHVRNIPCGLYGNFKLGFGSQGWRACTEAVFRPDILG